MRGCESLSLQGEDARGPASSLRLVGMVLSGYNDGEHGSLWRETCYQLARQFQHPYLRAVFAFLTSESKDFKQVGSIAAALMDSSLTAG